MSTAIAERAASINWFHSMDLGGGVHTEGTHDPAVRLSAIGLPTNLSGRTVLDIGAWDGFFSFESKRRGAERVLATDHFCWSGEGWGSREGFDLAREALGLTVEDRDIDVLELSPDTVGVFDVVLFLNVFYHLRHPLLALERVASVTGDHLILETHADLMDEASPAMTFYPGDEMWGDGTTWWGPNIPLLEALLRDVGFSRVEVVSRTSEKDLRAHALYLKKTRDVDFHRTLRRSRVVVHAFR